MKFKDMPYKRVDFDKVAEDMKALMAELDAAKSGEEQFAVHKNFMHFMTQWQPTLPLHKFDMT